MCFAEALGESLATFCAGGGPMRPNSAARGWFNISPQCLHLIASA
jgi:hypothetical protein